MLRRQFGSPVEEVIFHLLARGETVPVKAHSEMHCNFLINLGGATAADIETLGETVRRRVRENSGVELEWEIKRIGTA